MNGCRDRLLEWLSRVYKKPDGSTLKDLGLITATTDFSFNADIAGNYIIVVVSGGNTLGFMIIRLIIPSIIKHYVLVSQI